MRLFDNKYLIFKALFVLGLALLTSCFAKKKIKTKENTKIPQIEIQKQKQQYFEGQNLTPRQERKLEKMVSKIEKSRKKRLEKHQKVMGKGKAPSKRFIKKYEKMELREYLKWLKIKRWHRRKNLKNQEPKVRRRLRRNRRKANRVAKGKKPYPWYIKIFN